MAFTIEPDVEARLRAELVKHDTSPDRLARKIGLGAGALRRFLLLEKGITVRTAIRLVQWLQEQEK